MWMTSGSPSPSRSSSLTTASGARPAFMSVSMDTLLVPFTKAATAHGLTKSGFFTCWGLLVRGFAKKGIVVLLKLHGKPRGRHQQRGSPQQDSKDQERQDTIRAHFRGLC